MQADEKLNRLTSKINSVNEMIARLPQQASNQDYFIYDLVKQTNEKIIDAIDQQDRALITYDEAVGVYKSMKLAEEHLIYLNLKDRYIDQVINQLKELASQQNIGAQLTLQNAKNLQIENNKQIISTQAQVNNARNSFGMFEKEIENIDDSIDSIEYEDQKVIFNLFTQIDDELNDQTQTNIKNFVYHSQPDPRLRKAYYPTNDDSLNQFYEKALFAQDQYNQLIQLQKSAHQLIQNHPNISIQLEINKITEQISKQSLYAAQVANESLSTYDEAVELYKTIEQSAIRIQKSNALAKLNEQKIDDEIQLVNLSLQKMNDLVSQDKIYNRNNSINNILKQNYYDTEDQDLNLLYHQAVIADEQINKLNQINNEEQNQESSMLEAKQKFEQKLLVYREAVKLYKEKYSSNEQIQQLEKKRQLVEQLITHLIKTNSLDKNVQITLFNANQLLYKIDENIQQLNQVYDRALNNYNGYIREQQVEINRDGESFLEKPHEQEQLKQLFKAESAQVKYPQEFEQLKALYFWKVFNDEESVKLTNEIHSTDEIFKIITGLMEVDDEQAYKIKLDTENLAQQLKSQFIEQKNATQESQIIYDQAFLMYKSILKADEQFSYLQKKGMYIELLLDSLNHLVDNGHSSEETFKNALQLQAQNQDQIIKAQLEVQNLINQFDQFTKISQLKDNQIKDISQQPQINQFSQLVDNIKVSNQTKTTIHKIHPQPNSRLLNVYQATNDESLNEFYENAILAENQLNQLIDQENLIIEMIQNSNSSLSEDRVENTKIKTQMDQLSKLIKEEIIQSSQVSNQTYITYDEAVQLYNKVQQIGVSIQKANELTKLNLQNLTVEIQFFNDSLSQYSQLIDEQGVVKFKSNQIVRANNGTNQEIQLQGKFADEIQKALNLLIMDDSQVDIQNIHDQRDQVPQISILITQAMNDSNEALLEYQNRIKYYQNISSLDKIFKNLETKKAYLEQLINLIVIQANSDDGVASINLQDAYDLLQKIQEQIQVTGLITEDQELIQDEITDRGSSLIQNNRGGQVLFIQENKHKKIECTEYIKINRDNAAEILCAIGNYIQEIADGVLEQDLKSKTCFCLDYNEVEQSSQLIELQQELNDSNSIDQIYKTVEQLIQIGYKKL